MMYNGEKDVTAAGTSEPLMPSSSPRNSRIATWVIVQARETNTGAIYVGSPNVTSSNGVRLLADDSKMYPPVADLASYDLSLLRIDSQVDGEGAKFEYFLR